MPGSQHLDDRVFPPLDGEFVREQLDQFLRGLDVTIVLAVADVRVIAMQIDFLTGVADQGEAHPVPPPRS
jgi:hypothetical protein